MHCYPRYRRQSDRDFCMYISIFDPYPIRLAGLTALPNPAFCLAVLILIPIDTHCIMRCSTPSNRRTSTRCVNRRNGAGLNSTRRLLCSFFCFSWALFLFCLSVVLFGGLFSCDTPDVFYKTADDQKRKTRRHETETTQEQRELHGPNVETHD